MTKRATSKFAGGALAALVAVFGVILLVLAVPLMIQTIAGPGIGAFAFSVSRRMFTAALATLLALIATGLLIIVRALRRRHLH